MKRDQAWLVAQKKIKDAGRWATSLDLSWDSDQQDDKQLTELPDSLWELTELRTLDISFHRLIAIPEWLGELPQLRSLNVSHNHLKSLPSALGDLHQLQMLDVANNRFAQLSPSLGKLSHLQVLNLSYNPIAGLPKFFFNLTSLINLDLSHTSLREVPKALSQLARLRSLDLSKNTITALPELLGQLTRLECLYISDAELASLPESLYRLTQLHTLHLDNNKLTALPEFLGQLRKLKTLRVSGNRLTVIPQHLGGLPNLRTLDLSNNQLESLPPDIGNLATLEILHLHDNRLTSLPSEISRLKVLYSLSLFGNPNLGLPPEVVGVAPTAASPFSLPVTPKSILDYYFNLQQQKQAGRTRPLNEAKILVLGQPEAGKSSLIHALTEGWPTPDFTRTDGIVRKDWRPYVCEGKLAASNIRNAEEFRLNLWDFGGQEIYKATHTYFLTRRAIYVIVTTARKDTTMNQDLEEWLETARTFGSGAPVWIVINKHDENPTGGPDEQELMRKYYPMLRGFIRTQCQHAKSGSNLGNGAGLGIDVLRDRLLAETWAMPDVRQPMTLAALAIKSHLERMPNPTLSVESYRELCTQLGVDSESLQSTLLDLWDKLGTVRYFPEPEKEADGSAMHETAILNPEWVTEAVYKLLEDPRLKAANGLVTDADLHRITRALKHPPGSHRLIADVLRRFSQLYEAGDGRMFIPQLLEDQEPNMAWWPAHSLRFVYRYPVLPPGLIPSFIARTHVFHSAKARPWRRGCVLELQGCLVRVIGDKRARQVEISVAGDHPRDALDHVRFKFEELHAAMAGLDSLEELIPVPDFPDAPMISYRFLRTLEDEGVSESHFPADLKSSKIASVSISAALGDVRGAAMKARETAMRPTPNVEVHIHNNHDMSKPNIHIAGNVQGCIIGDHGEVTNTGPQHAPINNQARPPQPLSPPQSQPPPQPIHPPAPDPPTPWWRRSMIVGAAFAVVVVFVATVHWWPAQLFVSAAVVVTAWMMSRDPILYYRKWASAILSALILANVLGFTFDAQFKGQDFTGGLRWQSELGLSLSLILFALAALLLWLDYKTRQPR